MTKRNLITEIQEKNARASSQYLHGNLELYALQYSFCKTEESNTTLLALHVMGIASCIEVSTREAIKRLVDSGDPFLERAEAFKESIRFDFSLTKALSTRAITFGDLISHSLQVSRLDHIASHFETLLNDKADRKKFQKILSEIREFAEPSDEELFGNDETGLTQKTAPFLINDVETLLKDIASIFEIRHIIAHEANFNAVSFNELSNYLNSARLFVDALYESVEQILNPGASRNGYGLSVQALASAGDTWTEAQAVKHRILEKIASTNTEDQNLSDLFHETIRTFDSHHEAETNFRLALHGMATGNAMRNIEADVMLKLWSHRLGYLIETEENVDFYDNHNKKQGTT